MLWAIWLSFVPLAFAPLWFPPLRRALRERRPETSEVVDVLVDLLETAAGDLEQWLTRDPTLGDRVVYLHSDTALWHTSGKLKAEQSGYGYPRYSINGVDVKRRGVRVVRQLLADHRAWREERRQLAELQRVTEALRA